MTRAVILYITGDNQAILDQYAQELADLVDEAMVSHEKEKKIPQGVTYDGVDVIDPDKPEDTPTIEPEVVT